MRPIQESIRYEGTALSMLNSSSTASVAVFKFDSCGL